MAAYEGSFTSALLLLLLLLLSSFRPAPGRPLTGYPAVFNFGDSNSDTGGLVAGVAFPVGPPNGETYFHEPSGRFSDGRLIVDFLSKWYRVLNYLFLIEISVQIFFFC
ncbi:unnamed protein product [Linum tenue]|uniref:GDSL esterase/lipase n=1 Tax=Linum tenue TaxID=586396 RepID=A0AAV0ICX7_9ROSI|nr:unnamed protein product [Linum tenue]